MSHSWKIAFREFLDAMPIPAYLFDPESKRFVAANPSFCELVGYPEPELIQLKWPRIMADEGETRRANEEIAGREEDVFRNDEFAFRRRDGSRVNTNILYRVMRVSVRHEPTRHVYFAAVIPAEEHSEEATASHSS